MTLSPRNKCVRCGLEIINRRNHAKYCLDCLPIINKENNNKSYITRKKTRIDKINELRKLNKCLICNCEINDKQSNAVFCKECSKKRNNQMNLHNYFKSRCNKLKQENKQLKDKLEDVYNKVTLPYTKAKMRLQKAEFIERLEELEKEIYDLNRQISFKWIGLKQKPKEADIIFVNRKLGEWIKKIREIKQLEEGKE